MDKKKRSVDVIDHILEACYKHNPDALFIMSLMHQYEERGSLSKKQLEGLYQKASSIKDMPSNWLATLEATILKMPTRSKSQLPENKPLYIKDIQAGEWISAILNRYPQHKRVLFLQSKYNNNEPFSSIETTELQKLHKLLVK